MPRTIVYARPMQITDASEKGNPRYSGGGAVAPLEDAAVTEGDDFAAKLVKYIPGEALALVALISSLAGISQIQVVSIVVVGGIGQLLWLHREGAKLLTVDRPSQRQYVFALVAYVAWVFGTSPTVCSVLGIAHTTGTITMASVAYLLPLVDDVAHARLDPKVEEPALRR
jgi:hypothetical protein